MNFNLWAYLYSGKHTDNFLKDNSLEMMETYHVFLFSVFDTVTRNHLCPQAVHNQVVVLFGGGGSVSRVGEGQS